MNDRSSGRLRVRSKDAGRQKLAELGIKPLALSADEAAAMWGLSQAQFLKEVAAGTLPPPIAGLKCKHPRWSLAAMERAMHERDGCATGGIENGRAPHDDLLMAEIRKRAARSP
jgi:hypothetical protein